MDNRVNFKLILRTFLQAFQLRFFSALYRTARGQALVAQHAQHFDLWPLAIAGAVFQNLDFARSGHAVVADLFLFCGHGPPQNQELADMLNWRRVEIRAEFLKDQFSGRAFVHLRPDFYQAVGIKSCVDFFFYGGCQTT